MPDDNRISAEITAANKALILTKITEIFALLTDVVSLSNDERQSILRIGPNREAMVLAFKQEMDAHPELVPTYVDTVDLPKDIAFRSDLLQILARVSELSETLSDTALAAASDILMAYYAFYNNVQQAAKRGVSGADAILSRLQQYIPRGRRAQPVTPTPTP